MLNIEKIFRFVSATFLAKKVLFEFEKTKMGLKIYHVPLAR